VTAVAPLSSAFIPNRKYSHLNAQNQLTLETLHSYLSPNVLFSDVFTHLNAHSNEYIFFKTDHHWTALGAYYAYEAFCEATGTTPVPKENMEKRTKSRFLGSLYSLTHDRNVKKNPDSVEYYVPHIATTASYFERETNREVRSSVFCQKCKGYDTFLRMDYPLMHIKTNAKNGKKIVVIKDSMGNAFVVYLINHYEELWVVDFRYSKHNLMNLIRKHNITDMVFAIGMYNAQSRSVAKKMTRLGTQNFSIQAASDTTSRAMPVVNDSIIALSDTINKDMINEHNTKNDEKMDSIY
ncbi:DHHW family protein, partial [Candidatus Symbiothrix dinenymphae]|uniref:DHHW family protein n=1 Tax=Candidatus Symbiothrix dinenymphae TaxID=467085 RepID=UPI000A763350